MNFKKIASCFDVDGALSEIDEHDSLWREITLRQDHPGSSHYDTECIYLRWCRDFTVESVFNDLVPFHMPASVKLKKCNELICQVHDIIGGDLGRSIVTKLKPGGTISPHKDEGLYAGHYTRFHLPLKTDNLNTMYCENGDETGEHCIMGRGDLWWFDHKKTHYVVNSGSQPRIHLIIDIHLKANEIKDLLDVDAMRV